MNTYYVVLLFFSITMVLYLLSPGEYQTLFMKYSNNPISGNDFGMDDLFSLLIDYAFSWNGALTGVSIFATALVGGFNLLAVVPMALLFLFLDLFIFPVSIIGNSGLPPELQLIMVGFIALTKIMIVIAFLRTGQ